MKGLSAAVYVLALCLAASEIADASAITGAGLGMFGSAYRPPLSLSMNLVCIGDSICEGFNTSSPPTTGWCNQSVVAARALGYSVTVNNVCQPSSSTWEWTCPNGFNCPLSSLISAGKANVLFISSGTNDFSGGNIFNGGWFHDLPVNTGTAINAWMGSISAVVPGSSTTVTVGTGVTANRTAGDWVMVAGSGVTGLDNTCAQVSAKTATTLTLSITSSGSTSSTGTAYLCLGSGGPASVAYVVPTVGGTTASSGPPSWILSGGTTDGSVTWGSPQSQSVTLTNAEANILSLAASGVAAGFTVSVTTLLPRGSVGQAQTIGNQEAQRVAFSRWEASQAGASGIKSVIPFYTDPIMGLDVGQTSSATCNGSPCYSDGVHPSDNGSLYLAQAYGMQGLFNAVRP